MSTEIEIKPNNCITNDPCALCGARCDPRGHDPFMAGTWALVCDECAKAHGLTDQLAAARAALDPFGSCPECGRRDGCFNVGRGHWFVCHEHRVCWCVGSNLFSSWKLETEDQQRYAHDVEPGWGAYEEVDGYHAEA